MRRSDTRLRWKAQATRPVLDAVVDAGAFRNNRIPKGWRKLVEGESLTEPTVVTA